MYRQPGHQVWITMWYWLAVLFCIIFHPKSVVSETSSGECDSHTMKDPLYLTPLLEENKIAEAQEKSRVTPDLGNTTSYSGYFTVNKTCESNLFFWFFPAQTGWEGAPVLLWVQGGPGLSSISSLFQEMGPFSFTDRLESREYSWNVKNNLLFIEQTVGNGYSFTRKQCFSKTEVDVGNNLYSAVSQFFQLFPSLIKNDFFIAGHSYAGHFIPALGHTIHMNNPLAKNKINMKGFMIGNGWMDAYYQYDMGSFLYQLGLIDDKGRDVYHTQQNKLREHLEHQEWKEALDIRATLLVGVYQSHVGNVNLANYLKDNEELPYPFVDFIQLPDIREALHVGCTNYSWYNPLVDENLGVDPILSVKPWVEELLDHYPIVFYTGQLDIVCGYPMVVSFLQALNWSGVESFKGATRHKWCIEGDQAGYIKGGHNLYDVFVRNAGHIVATNQPHWAFELVNSVTSNAASPLSSLDLC